MYEPSMIWIIRGICVLKDDELSTYRITHQAGEEQERV